MFEFLGKQSEEIKKDPEITNVKQDEEVTILEEGCIISSSEIAENIKKQGILIKDSFSREEANIEIKKLRQFFHALEIQLQ